MIRPVLENSWVETHMMEGSWGAEEGGQPRRLGGVGVVWKLEGGWWPIDFHVVEGFTFAPQEGLHLGGSHYVPSGDQASMQ